jgi:hypothetical protein
MAMMRPSSQVLAFIFNILKEVIAPCRWLKVVFNPMGLVKNPMGLVKSNGDWWIWLILVEFELVLSTPSQIRLPASRERKRAYLFSFASNNKLHDISNHMPRIARLSGGYFLIAEHGATMLRYERSRNNKVAVRIKPEWVRDLAACAIKFDLGAFDGNLK